MHGYGGNGMTHSVAHNCLFIAYESAHEGGKKDKPLRIIRRHCGVALKIRAVATLYNRPVRNGQYPLNVRRI